MKYDRLTRFLKFNVGDVEYSARLTLGMFEQIDDAMPKGDSLVTMFVNGNTPKLSVLKKAFCIGLVKDGVPVKGKEAERVFETFLDENGIQEAVNVYYALLAASHLLGASVSKTILENMGLDVKDTEADEVTEKNA